MAEPGPPGAPAQARVKSWPCLAAILVGGTPYLVTLVLALLAARYRFGDPLGMLGLFFLSYGFALLLIAPALFSMLLDLMRKDAAPNRWLRAGFVAGCLILASPFLVSALWSLASVARQ